MKRPELLALVILWGLGMCTPAEAQESGGVFDDPPPSDLIGISAKTYPPVKGRAGRMVEKGIEWLVQQQEEDGSFHVNRARDSLDDVGVTGLVVMALVGNGESMIQGDHKEVVRRAVQFLRGSQDEKSGLIGKPVHHGAVYGHGIATLALAQVYWLHRSPLLKKNVELAIRMIERARNPFAAWRYGLAPDEENDTSVTAWMVAALEMAGRSGLEVDPAALDGALIWLDEVTDARTGRVGYSARGGHSARTPANQDFPADSGEAMTAAGMYSHLLISAEFEKEDLAGQQAALMLKKLPEWEPEGLGMDLYYWHWGSRALARSDGREGRAWRKALERAASDGQEEKGDEKGSWAPEGPWGHAGGRVYATAMMVLALEAESLEKKRK